MTDNPFMVPERGYGGPGFQRPSVVDVGAFASALAPFLGGTVEPLGDQAITGDTEWRSYIVLPTVGLRLFLRRAKPRGVVEVSASVADIKLNGNDWPYRLKMPSANVSTDRPLATIAKDIQRRVIAAAAEPAAQLRQRAAELTQANDDLALATVRLRGLGVQVRLELEAKSADIFGPPGGPYLAGRLYPNGSVSIDRSVTFSEPEFAAVLRALAEVRKANGGAAS